MDLGPWGLFIFGCCIQKDDFFIQYDDLDGFPLIKTSFGPCIVASPLTSPGSTKECELVLDVFTVLLVFLICVSSCFAFVRNSPELFTSKRRRENS